MKHSTLTIAAVAALICAFSAQALDLEPYTTTDGDKVKLTVPAGETLSLTTEADILKLADFDEIEIPEGSELAARHNNNTTQLDLKANLSGGGRISFMLFRSVYLTGDSTAYTGEFFSSNTQVTVLSPAALGTTNKVSHYLANDWYPTGGKHSAFRLGIGVYSNEFHFIENKSLPVGANTVTHAIGHGTSKAASGEIRFAGSVHLHGDVTFYKNDRSMLIMCPIYQHDPVYSTKNGGFKGITITTSTSQVADFADGYIKVKSNCTMWGSKFTCGRLVVGNSATLTVYYGSSAEFSPNASLQFGMDLDASTDDALYKGAIKWDGGSAAVHSFSNLLYAEAIAASNVASAAHWLEMAGTLRVTGCGPDFGWNVKCRDYSETSKMSIELDSQTQPAGELKLISSASTMTGKITAKRGRIIIEEGARYTGVTNLCLSGEGIIEVRDPAAFAAGAVTVDFAGAESGTLYIPDGVTFNVKDVRVNGRRMQPGSFTSAAGVAGGAFRIMGGGTLQVSEGVTPTSNDDYIWTGAAGDGLAATAGNWYNSRLPKFDGTERLLISAGWMNAADIGEMKVSGTIRIAALLVSLKKDFKISDADGTGRIVLCQNPSGGNLKGYIGVNDDAYAGDKADVFFEHNTDDSTLTYEIAVPFEIATGKDFVFSSRRYVKILWTGSLSGGDPDHTLVYAWGKWQSVNLTLSGDNSGLLSPLRMYKIQELYVASPTALGSTNRVTELHNYGDQAVKFIGDGLTNDTPVRIWLSDNHGGNGANLVESRMWTTNVTEHFVQRGALHVIGHSTQRFFPGPYDFAGGIFAKRQDGVDGDDKVKFHLHPYRPVRIGTTLHAPESDVSIVCSSSIAAPITFATTGSVARTLRLERVNISCANADALGATTPYEVGAANSAMSFGGLMLNGHNQTIRSLCPSDSSDITASMDIAGRLTTVASDSAATLTVCPTSALPVSVVAFTNHAGLAMSGTADSSWTLARAYSDTDGDLVVNGGTLTFLWGAGWGGTNIVVNGGTLCVSTNSGAVAFGEGRANLSLAEGAHLRIENGEHVTVNSLRYNGVEMPRGSWRRNSTGKKSIAANFFDGEGVLRVQEGPIAGGFTLTLK